MLPNLDDCVQCPSGKYQIEAATYNIQSMSKYLWTPTGSNATALCNECPGKSFIAAFPLYLLGKFPDFVVSKYNRFCLQV